MNNLSTYLELSLTFHRIQLESVLERYRDSIINTQHSRILIEGAKLEECLRNYELVYSLCKNHHLGPIDY